MKSNYKNIDDANNKIDSIIKQFEISKEQIGKENAQLKHEINKQKNYNMSHAQRISELKKENEKLKAQRDYWEKEYYEVVDENDKQDEFIKQLKKEIKEASSDVGIFIKEKEELKQRISKLVSENTKLQNDLFSEQLIQDEEEDYINKLQQELFNNYLHQQQQERLITELKIALSSYNNFVDEMFPD